MVNDSLLLLVPKTMIVKTIDKDCYYRVSLNDYYLHSAIPKERKIISYIACGEWRNEWLRLNKEFSNRSRGFKLSIEKDLMAIDFRMEQAIDNELSWKIWGEGTYE